MSIFLSLIRNCLCNAEPKIYIDDIQTLCNDNVNCDNLMCCAIMKISKLDDDLKTNKGFFEDCDDSFYETGVPSYCHNYIKIPMFNYFQTENELTKFIDQKNTIDIIDQEISEKMKEKYTIKVSNIYYYELRRILIGIFVKKLPLSNDTKKEFLNDYVIRTIQIYNTDTEKFRLFNETSNFYESNQHKALIVKLDINNTSYFDYKKRKNIIYHMENFDYGVFAKVFCDLSKNIQKYTEQEKCYKNKAKQKRKSSRSMLPLKKEQNFNFCGDILIPIDSSFYMIEFIDRVKKNIIECKPITESFINDNINCISAICYERLKNQSKALSRKEKRELHENQRNLTIVYEKFELFCSDDILFFYTFECYNALNKEENNYILESYTTLQDQIMQKYCDAFLDENILNDDTSTSKNEAVSFSCSVCFIFLINNLTF